MTEADAARALFDRAMEIPEAERAEFVRAGAGEDQELARRVLGLLEHADEATTLPTAARGAG